MKKSNTSTNQEIITVKTINASPERIWKAWTNSDEVRTWWGPAGFSTETQLMDVKPGGNWVYIMHGPDGKDYANALVYDEVQEPNRLVYTHKASPEFNLDGWKMINTFEDIGGKTKVTMHAIYASPEEYNKHITFFNAVKGAKEMLQRLEKFVKE